MSKQNNVQRTSTVASFFILAIASGYYVFPLIQKSLQFNGIFLLLTISFFQSIIGILRYVMAQDLQLIESAYTVTSKLRQYCILPLFVYQLCLMYSISPEITNAHLIGILIAFVVGLAASRFDRDLLKIFLVIYLCSLVYLCYLNSNYYGLNAGLTFAFAHFVITDRYTYLDFPAIDFYNYCICFYLLFCWKAIND